MFQPNEIVVCTDKDVNYASNDSNTNGLTIGKKYRVKFIKYRGTYSLIYFMNDFNVLGHYYDYRFVTLTEHRKQKLNKICSQFSKKV